MVVINSACLLMEPGAEQPARLPLGGERKGSDQVGSTIINPIAANIVRLMEQAQQTRERHGFSEFYPQWWMYNKILEVEVEQGHGENKPELVSFLSDMKTAYGITAYAQFTPRQKNRFREILRN